MKKIVLFFFITIPAIAAIGQPPHKWDKHTLVFRFNNLNIIVSNFETIDSAFTPNLRYMQFPFPKKGFNIYGYYCKIILTRLRDPFLPSFQPTRIISDTSAIDTIMMQPKDIEMSLLWRGITNMMWESLEDCPKTNSPGSYPFSDDSIFHHGIYTMLDRGSVSSDTFPTIFTLRNKRTKQVLLQLNLHGTKRPFYPMLGSWMEDTSRTSKDLSLDIYMKFFGYPPMEEHLKEMEKETGIELENEEMKSTVVSFYFKSPGAPYKDSSMEYRLVADSKTDTNWHKTGHRILLTYLKHGNKYKLQVRYIIHPKYIKEYSFSIEPKWYQTTIFKLLLFLGIVFSIFVSALVAYRRRIIITRRKQEQLSLEAKAVRSQLNPHFVFNALGSIQNLINKNDINDANEYLTKFSSLLRETLNSNRKEFIPLVTEILILDTYLKLEQLRSDFDYHIYIDDAINKDAIEVPTLLLQPLVENAIKHGISEMEGKGVIKIQFQQKKETLLVIITDNGKGFDPTNSFSGIGLSLTHDRIRLLNQSLKNQSIKMDIKSNKNTGTTVHLIFQNWL
jgi:hypothetical protein